MNKILFGLVLMAGLASAGQGAAGHNEKGQIPDSVRRVIDSSIVLLRTHALHRDRPDWDYVRMRAYELAGQTDRWEDLGPAISWLFEAVDDHQGYMSVNGARLQWQRQAPSHLPEMLERELAKEPRVVRRLLPQGIGYLRVPGVVMDSPEYSQFAKCLQDSISALRAEGARKFIIDLRLNAERSMSPVPEGVSPISEGIFSMLKGLTPLSEDAVTPVAILTGHGTCGAAEWVAAAFKGRKHTRFIGEPTAGDAAITVRHPIVPGQVELFIAETVPMDRKHHYYPSHLIPDEWVPGGDDLMNDRQDKKIQAAVKWLEKN
jgi:hypothetical protein